jgi:uncharacterized protein
VNEFRAQFDGNRSAGAGEVLGQDPAAHAIAGFDNSRAPSSGSERTAGGETRRARSHDQYVVLRSHSSISSSHMRIVRQASFKAVPWKNGGGVTHEAMRVPADGEPFRWRVSVARIDVSGPFSDFTGYERKMVLLKGGGVELRFADGTARALRAVGEMADFDGALAARCELIDGPCIDLNLIVAKPLQEVSARVALLQGTLTVPGRAGRATLAFPIDGAVEISCRSDRVGLEPWDLALMPAGEDFVVDSARCALARPAAIFLANLPE